MTAWTVLDSMNRAGSEMRGWRSNGNPPRTGTQPTDHVPEQGGRPQRAHGHRQHTDDLCDRLCYNARTGFLYVIDRTGRLDQGAELRDMVPLRVGRHQIHACFVGYK